MNNMKKTLLIILCCCLTIGMQAQTTKLLREYQNPKIEGLLNYAESLGREVTVVHTGEYKRMSFFVERYNDFRYKIEGRDIDDDLHGKLNQEYDERERKSVLLMDSIRNTFSALLDEASIGVDIRQRGDSGQGEEQDQQQGNEFLHGDFLLFY